MQRLDHLLARNLGLSRTAVARLVREGRVLGTDGAPMEDARRNLAPTDPPEAVSVDGKSVHLHHEHHLLLHKPLGCVTALRDARHATAYTLVRDAPLASELRPVGRLDLDTSGLLLWSTDGAWIQRLTHPKRAVPRRYHAALARPFRRPEGEVVLADGHRPQLVELRELERSDVHPGLVVPRDAVGFASVTLIGGAYHEVRRLFAALESHVLALCRVGFGRLVLPSDLPAGEHRPVRMEEV